MQEKMIGRIIGNISNTYKIKTNKDLTIKRLKL